MDPIPVTILRVQGDARAIVREGEIVVEGGGVTVEPMVLWYSVEGSMLRVGTGTDGACEGDQVVPDNTPCKIPTQGMINDLEAADSGELQVETSKATLNSRGLTCTVVGAGTITFADTGDFPSVLECTLSGDGKIRFEKEARTKMFECRLENSACFEGGPLVVRNLIEVHAKDRSVIKGVKPSTSETRVNINAEHSVRIKVSKLPRSEEARAKKKGAGVSVSLGSGGGSGMVVSTINEVVGNGNTITVGGRSRGASTILSSIASVGSGNTITIGGQVECRDNSRGAGRKRKAPTAARGGKRMKRQTTTVIPCQVGVFYQSF